MGGKSTSKKEIKGRIKRLGFALRHSFKTKRFNGEVFGFAFASPSRTSVGKLAVELRDSGIRDVKITKEGDQFVVWERFKRKERIIKEETPRISRGRAGITPKRPRIS